ncbi:MAG: transglycosylase SLT domain-containing protein [Desulfomonile sp.]|nr:transglycosylase SLT domain-containing protein [Desulfomonile sp.]
MNVRLPAILFICMLLSWGVAAIAAPKLCDPAAERLFVEGKKLYDSGQPARAVGIWEKVLDDNILGPVATILSARACRGLGNPELEESLLKDLLKKHPDSPYRRTARDALVDALAAQGKAEARTFLQEIIKTAPKEEQPALTLRAARLERRLGNDTASADFYRRIMLSHPASVEGLAASEELTKLVFLGKVPTPTFSDHEQLSRADALFKSGRFDLAIDIYRTLLKKTPSDTALSLKVARCLYKNRRNREAVQQLKKLLDGTLPDKERMEATHLLSFVYWRLDMGKDFEEVSQRIIDKGPPEMKRKALFNLGAYHLERHRLDQAETFFKRFIKAGPDRSGKVNAMWKIAWIKYSRKQYSDAATAFRAAGNESSGGKLQAPGKYWQARSLMLSNRAQEAQPILKEIARSRPFDYYGLEAARLLKSMGVTPERTSAEKPFPDLNLTEQQRSHPFVAAAEKLMEHGLHEFALLNLEALPSSMKSAPAVAFLRAKAAHGAHQYRRAYEVLAAEFAGFLDTPRPTAPKEFIEIAFPRVHASHTFRNAARHSVDPYLVWAVIRQESMYDECAVSPAGALGLMQVTPVASGLVKSNERVPASVIAKIMDPKQNIAFGINVLAKNLRSFKGDLVPAIASYNADIRKVKDWVRRNGKMQQDEFIESIPYLETRLYVKKVLAGYRTYSYLHTKKDIAGFW